ncbi:MAG: hypothetical protein Q9183_008046, partial [Haloplaca sp. 2 TL-2023]
DGNGFRKYLKEDLSGAKVEYVGSLRSGTLTHGFHEGHAGQKIHQMMASAVSWTAFQPNVILLHVGTDDVINGSEKATTGMKSPLDPS